MVDPILGNAQVSQGGILLIMQPVILRLVVMRTVIVIVRHGGQGESPVPPYTRGSVSLSRLHGGQGESLVPPYTHGSVSL